MRLAISNIAWDVAEDAEVAALLKSLSIGAIDIAPGKYFPNPQSASVAQAREVKDWWASHGIEITGMQSLLFGTTGLNVFGAAPVQDALFDRLLAVFKIAETLGASRLVFGSPRNRDRTGLSDAEAAAIAVPFFKRVGEAASDHGIFLCLEPNPVKYGANFMTTSLETLSIVRQVDHPAVGMQFDTGALCINREDPMDILRSAAPFIGHVHASEPDLVPLGDGGTDHSSMREALAHYLPESLVSVEMVATNDEPHIESIRRALHVALRAYAIATPSDGEST